MNTIRIYKISIIQKSLTLFALVLIGAAVTHSKMSIYGLTFGYLVSIVNFHLMSLDIQIIALHKKSGAVSQLVGKYFMRYTLIGLAMMCAVTYKWNIVFFILGVFLITFTIYANTFFVRTR